MNKKIKALICVVIALILAIFPFTALGSDIIESLTTKRASAHAELLQDGSFNITFDDTVMHGSSKVYGITPTKYEEFESYIYNELYNFPDEIDGLRHYGISTNDIVAIYSKIINDNPDLFYVTSSFEYSYYPDYTVASIYPEYAFDSSQIDSAQETFDAGVKNILKSVDDSMTDLQKCLVLHDKICDMATYPDLGGYDEETGTYENDRVWYHSAYGLFYDGNIVCAGYTLLYSYLLKALNIPVEYVVSDTMGHAWNKVMIDGDWYNIDLTFDDLGAYDGLNMPGAIMHRCFMVSDKKMESKECFFHYDGVNAFEYKATNTKYDDYFWSSITTNIPVYKGDFYYIENKTVSRKSTFTIKKRTLNGDVSDVQETSYDTAFNSIKATYWDDFSQEYITVTINDYDSRLVLLNGKLFFASLGHIYCLANLKGYWEMFPITACTTGEYILGLGYNQKANLIYYKIKGNTVDHYPIELNKLNYYKPHISLPNHHNYLVYVDIDNNSIINAKDYAMILKNEIR